jgi:hypothetical protein
MGGDSARLKEFENICVILFSVGDMLVDHSAKHEVIYSFPFSNGSAAVRQIANPSITKRISLSELMQGYVINGVK